VFDLVGKTSLAELLAIYGVSNAVITHDSGPLHLASLSGAPTVALFGPTVPLEKVRPAKHVRVLWGGEDLPCRPCYDGKRYASCADNQCLKQISVAQVITALQQLLDAGRENECGCS